MTQRDYLSSKEITDLTGSISMDHIQKRIEEETGLPAGTLSEVKNHRRRRRKLTSTAAAAAAAVFLLGGAAVYAWQGNYLAPFFGADSQIPVAQILAPGDSVTEDGLVITLEEILPGEDSALVVVSYQWEDGSLFSEAKTTWVGSMDFRVGDDTNYQSGASWQLLNGGRQLVWYYEINHVPLMGDVLTISGDTLYNTTFEELPLSATLADYFAATDHVFTLEEAEAMRDALLEAERSSGADLDITRTSGGYVVDKGPIIEGSWISQWLSLPANSAALQEAPIALPLQDQLPNLKLGGMMLIEDSLYITTWDEDPASEKYYTQNRAVIHQLLDNRTGETIYASGLDDSVYFFNGIQAEDLPHLTPVVSYDIYDVLTEAEWVFKCQIEDRGQILKVTLEDVVPSKALEKGAIQLTKAVISPLEVTVYGRHLEEINEMGVPPYYPEAALLLADGTVHTLEKVGGHADNMWDFSFRYLLFSKTEESPRGGAESEQRLFLSEELLNSVEYLVLDGQKIPVK